MPISAQAADFLVNTTTAGAQNNPTVTQLSDGRIVIAWNGPTSSFQILDANGTPTSSEISVPSGNPHVVALPDGRLFVTYGYAAVDYRIYEADGTPVGSASSALAFAVSHSLTALSDGSVLIAYEDTTIGLKRIDSTGMVTTFPPVATTGVNNSNPRIAVAEDGKAIITWKDATGDNDILFRMVQPNGAMGPVLSAAQYADGSQINPSIALNQDGGFAIVWQSTDEGANDTDHSGESIRFRLFDSSGNSTEPEIVINQNTAGAQVNPSIAALTDGRYVVVWSSTTGDGDGTSARGILVGADGKTIGEEFAVNTTANGNQLVPKVAALADGRFVVTFQSNESTDLDNSDYAVHARIFDPTTFNGTAGPDTWTGGNLTDNIYGGGGDDNLYGGGGDDVVSGDAGNDNLYGGGGNDKVFGGSGLDFLYGGTGKDSLYGGAGDDAFFIMEGDQVAGEVYSGGANDSDTLVVEWTGGFATFDLEDVQLDSIERLELGTFEAHGTGGMAVVQMTAPQFSSIKEVYGSDWNGNLNTTNETIDIVAISMGTFSYIDLSLLSTLYFDVGDFFVIDASDNGYDFITGAKNVSNHLYGRDRDDALTGGDKDDQLTGGTGVDQLHGGSGNDRFYVEAGDVAAFENYDGGADFDTVVAGSVFGTPAAQTIDLRGASFTAIEQFELLWTSSDNSITLRFDAAQLSGQSYNFFGSGDARDTDIVRIEMGSSNSINLIGITTTNFEQAGDRFIIVSGAGNDTITGSNGAVLDIVDYSGKGNNAATVDLILGTGRVAGTTEVDTLIGIEGAIGSNGANVMTGDGLANFFAGGGGKDTLKGGGGNDTLKGGAGNDSLDGGLGNDTADYSDKTANVVLVLDKTGKGTAKIGLETDNLVSIENAIGGSGNNTFTGADPANFFNGGAGNDTLNGGLGNDTLTGGLGADRFVFSTAANALTNVDTITDFEHGIDKFAISAKSFKGLPKAMTVGAFNSDFGMTTAQQLDDRLIYNKSNGNLYFDADGLGGKVGAILIANIANFASITFDSGDIIII